MTFLNERGVGVETKHHMTFFPWTMQNYKCGPSTPLTAASCFLGAYSDSKKKSNQTGGDHMIT